MISADSALETVLGSVAELGIERIPIRDALGRVIAEAVRSPRAIPGFDNSAMDGYAVRAADVAAAGESTPVRLRVTETIAAGTMSKAAVARGEAARIMTGAPLPQGADTIVPVERTRSSAEIVEILAAARPAEFVRPIGEDLKIDELVIENGKPLGAADLGMLASLNRSTIDVYRRPRVAVVSTGDELVDVDQVPTGAQIVNSSMYALAGGIVEAGGEAVLLKTARDRVEEIRERISEALSFDAILTTGGVSVGQFDHVKAVLDELGLRQLFHGVAQKPGRPLKFGLIGHKPVFGLPGNPVSTMVCFYLYARPALRRMGGRPDLGLPRVMARCSTDIKIAKDLTEFVRVKITRRDGELHAVPTGAQGSGILSSLSRADGLLIGPANETVVRAGTQATVLLLTELTATDSSPGFDTLLRRQMY